MLNLKILYTLFWLLINRHNTTLNSISFLNSCYIYVLHSCLKKTCNTNIIPEEFSDIYSKIILT